MTLKQNIIAGLKTRNRNVRAAGKVKLHLLASEAPTMKDGPVREAKEGE